MTSNPMQRWFVRGAAAVVAVLVAGGAITGAHVVGGSASATRPAGRTVTPAAAEATRVCDGSVLQLADSSGADATSITAVGEPVVASATTGANVVQSTLKGSASDGNAPAVLTAPAGSATPQVAGGTYQEVDSGDLAGIAASSCDDPSTSTWLVGGSTVTGRTSLITLSNPTNVTATVSLAIADASGAVSAPGTSGIVVAAKSQRVVPLSGFVSDQGSTVVHVTSSGGEIVAHLQESVVRTLTAGGVDIVSGAAAPSRVQTIPGVVLKGEAGAVSGDTASDTAPIVRLYVPGAKAARVSIGITSASGGGTTVSATAQPGTVTDVPLDGFSDGIYSVTVRSNVSVVAGARSTTATDGDRSDLGWFSSAAPLTSKTTAAFATGSGLRLSMVNPTDHDANVVIRWSGGQKAVTVLSGAMATLRGVPSGTALTITGAKGMIAGATYSNASGIAGVPVRAATDVSAPITVYP